MGNIKNYNFNKLDIKLSNSDYWDFFLSTDETPKLLCTGLTAGDCFVVWYDFNESIYSGNSIHSLVTWNGATNTGYTMNTAGLTCIDNGFVMFDIISGDTSNQALSSALTGTTLVISSGDTRLMLNAVTGVTANYIYPIDKIIDPTFTLGDYVNLCGGFYQGYYKLDGNTYETLPVRMNNAWSAEFWLMPQDICSGHTGTTLNDVYPNNKGFFFYMGTRAENKFWNTFHGVDSGCTSGCTADSGCTDTVSPWCTVQKETDIVLVGDYNVGIPLNPPLIEIDLITNPFLIYGRSSGYYMNGGKSNGLGTETVGTYSGDGKVIVTHSKVVTNTNNPFLIYGRSSGYYMHGGKSDGFGTQSVGTFSGFTQDQTQLDVNADIIDNALGFRIKDDGSIGYRLLTVTGHCVSTDIHESVYVSGVTIQEEYSLSGMVLPNTWSYIAIRFVMPYMDDCQLKTTKARKGKLMFYVNGKLKFVVNEFDEVIAKRLNENKLKQVGVPFNFSLGGGSQGLAETRTFDGPDYSDAGLPIETNFGGSFIGAISQFKFNICDLSFCNIQHNYITEAARYGIQDTNLILSEDGEIMLQENGYGIEWP